MPEEPLTRADFANLSTLVLDNIRQVDDRMRQMDERMGQMEQQIRQVGQDMHQMEERTFERIYDTQNVMLTEFHKWAAPVATRVTAHQTLISLAEERLEILERKVK